MSWTATGGGSHDGADWTISAAAVGGTHTGVGVFTVATGSSSVQTAFSVSCQSAIIIGDLISDASGHGDHGHPIEIISVQRIGIVSGTPTLSSNGAPGVDGGLDEGGGEGCHGGDITLRGLYVEYSGIIVAALGGQGGNAGASELPQSGGNGGAGGNFSVYRGQGAAFLANSGATVTLTGGAGWAGMSGGPNGTAGANGTSNTFAGELALQGRNIYRAGGAYSPRIRVTP